MTRDYSKATEVVDPTASYTIPEPPQWKPSPHTCVPGTGLAEICEEVCRLQPGQCIDISHHQFVSLGVTGYYHNDVFFDPGDRVIGNIVGGAWTHTKRANYDRATITFCRVEEPEGRRKRTYYAPDDHIRKQRLERERRHRQYRRDPGVADYD